MFDEMVRRPPPRRLRTVILLGSAAVHGVIAVAAVVLMMGQVEKLVPERAPIIFYRDDSPIDPGSEAPKPEVKKPPLPPAAAKRPIAKGRTQPPDVPEIEEPKTGGEVGTESPGPTAGGTGTGGAGLGADPCPAPPCDTRAAVTPPPVCGNGLEESGEACDDGNRRDGDGCSASCTKELRPVNLAPRIVATLRLAGENQIQPPAHVRSQMVRDGAQRVRGVFQLCIDTTGRVAAVQQRKSTGYDDYDQRLVSAMRQWRYRPYTSNGQPVPVCTSVDFVYVMR